MGYQLYELITYWSTPLGSLSQNPSKLEPLNGIFDLAYMCDLTFVVLSDFKELKSFNSDFLRFL